MISAIPASNVDDMAFAPKGRLLSAGDVDLDIWSVPSGKRLFHSYEYPYSVQCLSFSPDGRILATGSVSWSYHLH